MTLEDVANYAYGESCFSFYFCRVFKLALVSAERNSIRPISD